MKILVTGGTGLIGTNLVMDLVNSGHSVEVLTRSPEQEIPFPDKVKLIEWDASSTVGWLPSLEKSDAVINLAGENIAGKGFLPQPWTPDRRKRILQSRIKVGSALVKGFQETSARPDLLIQASAVGIYGSPPGNQTLDESSPPGEGFLPDVCRAWEDSTRPVEALGVRRTVCRLGIVLDPRGGALKRMLLPFKFFVGGRFGSGKQWYSWIHRDDVSFAVQHLLSTPGTAGIYNFTAPNPVSNQSFSRMLGRALDRPCWLPVPGFVLQTLFGDVSSVVLEGQRVIPERLTRSGFQFRYPELQPALYDLTTGE